MAFNLEDDRERKLRREGRLRLQSRLMLLIVMVPSTASLAGFASSHWTFASKEGLAICAVFGLIVWGLRAATPLASLTGFVLTSCIYLGTVEQPGGRWFHSALLPGLTLFVLAFTATRFRRAQKEKTGIAESRRGRNAAQVAANMGVAAVAAFRFTAFHSGSGDAQHSWSVAGAAAVTPIIAALAEAAADTVSSEIGQALGGMPMLITNFRRVSPGTDGAITLGGTLAGCGAATVVVLVAATTLQMSPRLAATAWGAAIVGLFADSLIGATLERRDWLNNDAVNFLSTAIAALAAWFV